MTTLKTARLSLRPLTKLPSRNLGWLRDKEVVRYSEQRHREHTLSTQLKYITSFVGKSRLWAIHLAGEHIGNLSARHDAPNDVADVGIMIGETHVWGKGYAGEAWKAACDWLLDKDGGDIRKLEAGCAQTNTAMKKIILRSKFEWEGERKKHFLFDGNPVSMVLFGRSK